MQPARALMDMTALFIRHDRDLHVPLKTIALQNMEAASEVFWGFLTQPSRAQQTLQLAHFLYSYFLFPVALQSYI